MSDTNIEVHFSSKSNDWRTPLWLYDLLSKEFAFDLDAAADVENSMCKQFYTEEMDALKQDWGRDAKTVWINPPYSRIGPKFIAKAHEETIKYPHLTVVMLVPARTDTKVWHQHCVQGEIRFMKGRVKFVGFDQAGKKIDNSAPFPSAIVIFGKQAKPGTSYVEYREPK